MTEDELARMKEDELQLEHYARLDNELAAEAMQSRAAPPQATQRSQLDADRAIADAARAEIAASKPRRQSNPHQPSERTLQREFAKGQSKGKVEGLLANPGESIEIKRGDTLWALAKRYGVSVEQIAQANGIKDPSRIKTGETLRIPGGVTERESSGLAGFTNTDIEPLVKSRMEQLGLSSQTPMQRPPTDPRLDAIQGVYPEAILIPGASPMRGLLSMGSNAAQRQAVNHVLSEGDMDRLFRPGSVIRHTR